jgi:hypothetical protein
MDNQHHAVHDHLAQVATAAQSWRPAAAAGPRDALAEAVEQLLAITRDHLAWRRNASSRSLRST